MIDTIKGYIDLNHTKYSDIKHLLENSSKRITKDGYIRKIQIRNFIIAIRFDFNNNPKKMFFNGSLPKFYQGNNLFHLDWEETKKAIQMLSDNTNVDFMNAVLTRVDFGINIPVKHPVFEYINCLMAYPRLNTMRYKESITFYTKIGSRNYLFYDKRKEMKKEYLIDENILRYEIQLKKDLSNRFRVKKMKIKNLFKEKTQLKIIEYWFNSYQRIEKMSLGIDPDFLLDDHNGLQKYLSYHGLERLGYDRVNSKISNHPFNCNNIIVKRSKLKSTINKLLKRVKDSKLDQTLITELDDKIIFIKDYLIKNKTVPYFIL